MLLYNENAEILIDNNGAETPSLVFTDAEEFVNDKYLRYVCSINGGYALCINDDKLRPTSFISGEYDIYKSFGIIVFVRK